MSENGYSQEDEDRSQDRRMPLVTRASMQATKYVTELPDEMAEVQHTYTNLHNPRRVFGKVDPKRMEIQRIRLQGINRIRFGALYEREEPTLDDLADWLEADEIVEEDLSNSVGGWKQNAANEARQEIKQTIVEQKAPERRGIFFGKGPKI